FTFQKGQFSHQWKYLIHTIMQCLSPKSTWFNEFSINIATALVCLATNRTYNFSEMIFDGLVKNVNNKGEGLGTPSEPHHTPFPESSTLLTVADEPTSPVRDVSEREACPTKSSFIADQDRATIAQEVEIVKLKDRVKVLEDREGVAAKQSRDDAPIKERSINEGEAAAERISNDSKEIARVLTSMDAATVLAGGTDVPTGSGFIPTAGPPAIVISTGSEVGLTASPIVTRRKGKEVMVESDTPKKKKLQEQIDAQVARELEEQKEKEDMRMNEQIAKDAEVVRIHAEEELQGMIDSLDQSNETIA
nr:hypothetical protein [Tanacetum cinerariifolium]